MGPFKKIGILLGTLVVIGAFNNCSAPNSQLDQDDTPTFGDSLQRSPSTIENNGNGTPYGGKLKPGLYIPSDNQICDNNFQERIRVEIENFTTIAHLEIPCENREVKLSDSQFEATSDKDRLFYQSFGYAHESTLRAQSKEYYMVACRTTEANFGAEILVYGPGPVYSFENISLDTDLTVYSTSMNFYFQYFTSSRHAFIGDKDSLFLQKTEDPSSARFLGGWDSNLVDTSDYKYMICDTLSTTPVNEW